MTSRSDSSLLFRMTRFYVKFVGCWYTKTEREERIRRVVLGYTIGAVTIAAITAGRDLYFSWGDFETMTESICDVVPLMTVLFKLIVCLIRRNAVLDLILFSEKKFWNVTYDEFGEKVMKYCEKKGMTFLCILSLAVQGSASARYVIAPVFANMGRNETDRELPVNFWLNIPLYKTPWFEIAWTVQMLCVVDCTICFFCFDNLLGIMNVYVVGQFRILQNRLENLCEEYVSNMNDEMKSSTNFHANFENYPNRTFYSTTKVQNDLVNIELEERLEDIGKKAFAEFKECVKQHLVLIEYIGKLEYVFNPILFCQMGISSIFMCFSGFQILVLKHYYFIFNLISSFTQLLLFTWTCHEIMDYSLEIGDAIYYSKWYTMPNTGAGRAIRHGLIMMTARSKRICYLSAGKFGAVSLKSFTGIMSTTMSYLSVLRQVGEEL